MNETSSEIKSHEVEEILRLLACSDLRNNLAKALRNGKKMTLSELGEHVGASSRACVHSLLELGKVHVTHQDEKRNYSLTNIGEIVMRKFEEINLAITTLSYNREFWLEHDLSDIPRHSLDKVGCLADSSIVSSTHTEIFKVFSTFYTLAENSKEIRGLTPFFFEDLATEFIRLVDKNIDIELILTPDVLDATLKTLDKKELENALKKNLKLFKSESQPKVAFTVADYFLSLGLFRPDGTFDWSCSLISYNPDALEWGQELFAYYVERAEPVTLS